MDGNHYSKVILSKAYVVKVYATNYKSKAGDALKLFCQEFGVPEKINYDSSKEQACQGTTFMKKVHRQRIYCHVS